MEENKYSSQKKRGKRKDGKEKVSRIILSYSPISNGVSAASDGAGGGRAVPKGLSSRQEAHVQGPRLPLLPAMKSRGWGKKRYRDFSFDLTRNPLN